MISEGLKALLEALYQLGNQDIYTSSPEYRGRVMSMGILIGLLGRFLRGERMTKGKVAGALEPAKWDQG